MPLKQILNKHFIKKNKKVALMSATERDTFVWDATSKSNTTKKPNILGLYLHVDTVPEIFEKSPQINPTSSEITSNTTTRDPILPNNNLNPSNVEKDVYEITSTEMSEHINEPENEIPDQNSKSSTTPTYINTTESNFLTKAQSEPHDTSASTDVNQQLYNNTVKDTVIEIGNDSKTYHETKKFCKKSEVESLYENDRKCMDILEPKTEKLTDDESAATPETITLSNKFNLLQGATINTNHVACSHIASNFMFKLSTSPSVSPNTKKFKFIIGTKKEDTCKGNSAIKYDV